jgi:hypothetical protein
VDFGAGKNYVSEYNCVYWKWRTPSMEGVFTSGSGKSVAGPFGTGTNICPILAVAKLLGVGGKI